MRTAWLGAESRNLGAEFNGGIAILYAGLFRHAFAKSGIWFGLLLFFGSWYPLAQAGAQLLGYKPEPLNLMAVSGVVVALMFIPYALLLQTFISLRPKSQELTPACKSAH